jgi:hypothetical protein
MRLLVASPLGGAANPTAVQTRADAHDTPIRLSGCFVVGLGAVAGDQSLPFQLSTRAVVGCARFAQK